MNNTALTAAVSNEIEISILPAIDFVVELELAGALPVAVTLPEAVELEPVPVAVAAAVRLLNSRYAEAFVLDTFA
jgi:hypothetical protein